MKFLIVLAVVALAVARPDGDQYESKYDSINVDEIVSNPRLLKSYGLCFAGDGPCTQEASDIKEKVPEVVQTSCAKCTEKQKTRAAKFASALKSQLPDLHEKIYNMNDAAHKKLSEYEEFLTKYS